MNKPANHLSPTKLLEILSLSHKAVAVYSGINLRIEFANEAMLEFWKKERRVVGMTLEDGVPELQDKGLIERLKEVWQTGEDYQSRDQGAQLTVTGDLQWYQYDQDFRALINESGKTYAILHTAADVTPIIDCQDAVSSGLLREVELNRQLLLAHLNLQRSKDNFSSLVRHAPVAIAFLKGSDLEIELANEKILELWGRSESKVLGLSILNDTHNLFQTDQVRLLKRVLETREPYYGFSVQTQLLSVFSNFKRYFDVIYQPSINEDEEVTGVMVVATDVTEHSLSYQREQLLSQELVASHHKLAAINEKLQAANTELSDSKTLLEQISQELYTKEDQLRFLIDAAEIGTWELDMETLRIIGNERTRWWLGKHEHPYITMGEFYRSIHPDDYEQVSGAIRSAIRDPSKGQFHVEFQLTPEYAQPRFIAAKGIAIFNDEGQPVLFSGTLVDLSDRRKDNSRKDSPVQQNKVDKVEDEFKNLTFNKIGVEVSKMSTLINGVLHISRTHSGKLQLKKTMFDLDELILENILDAELTTRKHNFHYQKCPDTLVLADREKISFVIANLLSNAVKYSPEGGDIQITNAIIFDEFRVSVIDPGIGISPEAAARLFGRYCRVRDEETQEISGFGTGLYLSSEIIKSHNGHIWVQPNPKEKGSNFSFTLPNLPLSD